MCVREHERECSQTDGRTDHKDAKFKKNPIDPAIRFVMINFISVTTSMVDNIVPTSPLWGGGRMLLVGESGRRGRVESAAENCARGSHQTRRRKE